MTTIAADPWVLCEVVGHGPRRWRTTFLDAMHGAGYPLTDETVADRLFAFFCLQVQRLAHDDAPAPKLARRYLDGLDVTSPHVPSEAEIAESWELESASSPDGQRFAYGGKTKDETLQALKSDRPVTFSHEDG